MVERFRIFGSLGVVAGQIALLFYSRHVGLCILLVCSFMSLPYFIKHRYYDVVLLIAVGILVNMAGLFWGTFR